MKKASTLIRPGNWKSVFLVLFAWCLVGSIDAQTVIDLSNDGRTNGVDCAHDGTVFTGSGTFTDGAGLYPDDFDDSGFTGMIFWTFCPDDPLTERVRITFSEFDIVDAGDAFRIFNQNCADRAFGNVTLVGSSVGSTTSTPTGSAPDFGTGWAQATCENASGCLTVGFNPDGDGAKGNGFTFTTSTDSFSPEIDDCPSFTVTVPATCNTPATVTIPLPALDDACSIHSVGLTIDGITSSPGSATLVPGLHTIVYTLNVGDNQVDSETCEFRVPDAEDLVCNDQVNVSLGSDCNTTLTADDIIEGSPAAAFPLTISIGGSTSTVSDLTSGFFSVSEGIHTYRLTDACNNVCTGSISLVDLQGPTCPGNTIEYVLCGAAPAPEAPDFLDCNGVAETSSDDTIFGECGLFTMAERDALVNLGVGVGSFSRANTIDLFFILPVIDGNPELVESVTAREWKAVDGLGNTTDGGCFQIFLNVRPATLDAPAATLVVDCNDGTSPQDLIDAELSGAPSFSVEIPEDFSPITGSGSTSIQTGFILPNEHSVCGWITNYTDVTVEACGNSMKIIRTWTYLDWCAATPSVTESTQIIEVVDNDPPALVSGPGPFTESVGHFECTLDLNLPGASFSDNCGDVNTYRTEILSLDNDGNPAVVLWRNNQNGGAFANVALGNYAVRYFAIDECGNETARLADVTNSDWSVTPANVHTTFLNVVDDVAPQPQCDDNINISLGSDWGIINVAAVDEGSFDNCGVASMGISLSGDGPFEETVNVQCEDVHEATKVYLQVTDGSGNSNVCWGNVTVEDKIAPVCSAPADVTIFCDEGHFDIESGVVTGSVASDLNTRFGSPSCEDNVTCVDLGITQTVEVEGTGCGQFTVTRHFVATDWNNSSAPVYQTITVEYRPGWQISVPGDVDVVCTIGQEASSFSYSEDDIEVVAGSCDQLGVEVESREFVASGGACRKVEVTYSIINWCIYQPGDVAVVLPRNADGSGASFSSDDFATNSFLTYTRIFTLTDNVSPVVQDIANDGLCINGSDCTDMATWTAWADDCVAEDDMTWTSMVHETDAAGNIIATVATGNNFIIEAPIENKKYYVAEFWAADGCGNSGGASSQPEQAWDCVKPTPYAINGVAINLVDSGPDKGTVAVWASDVDQGSFDNCSGDDVTLAIAKAGTAAPTTGDEAIALGTSVSFDCTTLGNQLVDLFVIDEEGNFDFVTTYVLIQDNGRACIANDVIVEEAQVAGKIINPDGQSVQAVDVSVNGAMTSAMTTNNNGSFAFTVPTGGDYTITPENNNNPLNGVSTFDLVLISKHILNIESFTTPYEYIAADINQSGTITAFDMVQLRQLILNINTEFTNNTSWRFVDAAYNFGPAATTLSQNFPEIANINNIATDQLNVDFVAIKIGDINGSAIPSSLIASESRNANGTLVLSTEDRSVAKGERVSVSFTAADIASVEGYQFTMNYAGLDFTQIVDGVAKAANFNNVRGALATSWNGKATATDVLFTTEFTATADGLLSDLISVSSDVTAAEAYNTAGELLDIAIEFTATPAANFDLMQNTPNPFDAETVIGFNLPTAGEATLRVMDIQGKVLKAITADYTKGYNQVSLNAKELGATGVLQYQLESADNIVTKKMIIID